MKRVWFQGGSPAFLRSLQVMAMLQGWGPLLEHPGWHTAIGSDPDGCLNSVHPKSGNGIGFPGSDGKSQAVLAFCGSKHLSQSGTCRKKPKETETIQYIHQSVVKLRKSFHYPGRQDQLNTGILEGLMALSELSLTHSWE